MYLKAKEITQKTYPSIVHVDGSSRIQSVNIKSNKKFYDLLKKFKDKFSCPMLLNTSMNIDEPICESPTDVINSFANTKIDCIVMQKFVLKKKKLSKSTIWQISIFKFKNVSIIFFFSSIKWIS